jgi:hypothetical protein
VVERDSGPELDAALCEWADREERNWELDSLSSGFVSTVDNSTARCDAKRIRQGGLRGEWPQEECELHAKHFGIEVSVDSRPSPSRRAAPPRGPKTPVIKASRHLHLDQTTPEKDKTRNSLLPNFQVDILARYMYGGVGR